MVGKTGKALSGLNMSSLAAKGKTSKPTEALKIDIQLLVEDPSNVRQIFDEQSIQELADSIRQQGLLSPISVKPHPDLEGKYLINHGARRYRACLVAGLREVSVLLNTQHDMFAQMVENIQREDLNELEISLFIERAESEGLTTQDIADRLGKGASWVSRHKNLHTAPQVILDAVKAGIVRGAETIKLLISLFEKTPDAINSLLSSGEPITQKLVRQLKQDTTNLTPDSVSDQSVTESSSLVHVDSSPQKVFDEALESTEQLSKSSEDSHVGASEVAFSDPKGSKSPQTLEVSPISSTTPSRNAQNRIESLSDDVYGTPLHGDTKTPENRLKTLGNDFESFAITDFMTPYGMIKADDVIGMLEKLGLDEEQINLLLEFLESKGSKPFLDMVKARLG